MLYIKMIIFECNQLLLQTVTAELCGLVDVIAKQKMILGKLWILCQSLIKNRAVQAYLKIKFYCNSFVYSMFFQ